MKLNLKVLWEEVKLHRKTNPRLTRRLLALRQLAKVQLDRKLRDHDFKVIGAEFAISERTLYRWYSAYKKSGYEGINPKRAPGRKKLVIRGWTAKAIRDLRAEYNWGADVINAHLRHYQKIDLGSYRINKFLKEQKLFRKKRPYSKPKKHNRVVKIFEAGQHTQLDVKYLHYVQKNKKKAYVYKFIDHASRWQFKKAYDGYGAYETIDFMTELLKVVPFKIKVLQTDNGREFTNKFLTQFGEPKPHALDNFCEKNGIEHWLIPPGEKELNGLVERSHRTDDEEIYHKISPHNLAQLNEHLAKHDKWANEFRLRKKLGWISANTYLELWTRICSENRISLNLHQMANAS